MEHILESINSLFAKMLEMLNNHNEVFLIEGEEGFTTPDGEEVYEGDYQVYSDVDKFGHYNSYAISKLENGVAYVFGIGDAEGEKQVSLECFSSAELYDLASLCTNVEKPNE